MRNFFIKGLEVIVNVIAVLGLVGIVFAAGAAMFAPDPNAAIPGLVLALLILFGGLIYLTLILGFLYMAIGIHANTKRTAELLERLVAERA